MKGKLDKTEISGVVSAAYVTPPTRMAYMIARGASTEGHGISSVMCMAASNPIRDSAD